MAVEKTKFKRLAIGEVFAFADEIKNDRYTGPWVKADAKWYQHAETGEGFKIDSVNTVVIIIKQELNDNV